MKAIYATMLLGAALLAGCTQSPTEPKAMSVPSVSLQCNTTNNNSNNPPTTSSNCGNNNNINNTGNNSNNPPTTANH